MAKKKMPPKGMHQMPDGSMMSNSEMQSMMGGKTAAPYPKAGPKSKKKR